MPFKHSGASADQLDDLSKLSKERKADRDSLEKWYAGFKILFGTEASLPQSPYATASKLGVSQVALDYLQAFRAEGRTFLLAEKLDHQAPEVLDGHFGRLLDEQQQFIVDQAQGKATPGLDPVQSAPAPEPGSLEHATQTVASGPSRMEPIWAPGLSALPLDPFFGSPGGDVYAENAILFEPFITPRKVFPSGSEPLPSSYEEFRDTRSFEHDSQETSAGLPPPR